MTALGKHPAGLLRQRRFSGLARASNCSDPHRGSVLNEINYALHLEALVRNHA